MVVTQQKLQPSGLQQTKQFGQPGLTKKNLEVFNLKRRAERPAVLFVRRFLFVIFMCVEEIPNE